MNKLKREKGITLVALVITIIVLLILAVVAIGAVRDSGIVGYAQNSADRYNTEKVEEESMLGQYEDAISKYYSSTGSGNMGTDGDGLPVDTEVEWTAWIDESEDGTKIVEEIIYIGNSQELVLNKDKIIKAYELVYDPVKDEEYVSEEVISVKLSEVEQINIDNDGGTNVESLKLGTIAKDKEVSFYGIKTITILSEYGTVTEQSLIKDDTIETVIIEEGVTTIEYKAFYELVQFKNLTLPSTITSIADGAFYECENLENITINKSQGSIDLSNSGLTAEQIDKVVWAK